jgi:hypothetical protein
MLPEPGTKIELHYPTRTDVYADSLDWRRRELVIYRIRDLVQQPLSIEEYLHRPFVRRSRYLVIGKEFGRWKQFYLGSSREYHTAGQLRLGLYGPTDRTPKHLVSRPFDNTPEDRRMLYDAFAEWSAMDFGQLSLRVFCDDLRVVAAAPAATVRPPMHPPGGGRKTPPQPVRQIGRAHV